MYISPKGTFNESANLAHCVAFADINLTHCSSSTESALCNAANESSLCLLILLSRAFCHSVESLSPAIPHLTMTVLRAEACKKQIVKSNEMAIFIKWQTITFSSHY